MYVYDVLAMIVVTIKTVYLFSLMPIAVLNLVIIIDQSKEYNRSSIKRIYFYINNYRVKRKSYMYLQQIYIDYFICWFVIRSLKKYLNYIDFFNLNQ